MKIYKELDRKEDDGDKESQKSILKLFKNITSRISFWRVSTKFWKI